MESSHIRIAKPGDQPAECVCIYMVTGHVFIAIRQRKHVCLAGVDACVYVNAWAQTRACKCVHGSLRRASIRACLPLHKAPCPSPAPARTRCSWPSVGLSTVCRRRSCRARIPPKRTARM